MICTECLNPTELWRWHNNAKVCEKCHHNLQPISVRTRNVEDIPPTFNNLKKFLEKKF